MNKKYESWDDFEKLVIQLGGKPIAFRHSNTCINCGGNKKDGELLCHNCEKAEEEIEKALEKGITIEYEDGAKETLVGTKNPRKSTIYKKRR